MANTIGNNRRFLLLQGPHGPFFRRLGEMLRMAGTDVWRVGFNAGDQAFWRDKDSYIAFTGTQNEWADDLLAILKGKNVTDIVLYGDTRPIHATAIKIARDLGLTIHVFEEGYLRPFWVTYERDGSNGNSALMDLSVEDMRQALSVADRDMPEAPDHWGDTRQHVFYGALYHWYVMFKNGRYKNFQAHRKTSVNQEFRAHFKRLVFMPYHRMKRFIATKRIKWGGYPYHVAMLQLEHDASFQHHSPFDTVADFLKVVIEGFAEGAPSHHHLVFKAHPLEDGRVPMRQKISGIATHCGVSDRVHYVTGGKLAELLDHARTTVSVNSTAAQQALWRGLPLKTFGAAVYDKPEFVSEQNLSDFFAHPARPDTSAYRDYRLFLLETSQLAGGYYSARGRSQLLRQIVDLMLCDDDPYSALKHGTAAPRQQLTSVN